MLWLQIGKKDLSMQETIDYANHLKQVFKTTKLGNGNIEAKKNANNEKPKNNENTWNKHKTNYIKLNNASNDQEQSNSGTDKKAIKIITKRETSAKGQWLWTNAI